MYGLSMKKGRVEKIVREDFNTQLLEVVIPGDGFYKAINYLRLTGKVKKGNEVLLNTTAVELQLGTGGYHFVCCNLTNGGQKKNKVEQIGHIMKLRYTPFQVRTLSIEEEESPYHDKINKFKTLNGHPVVIIPLHSLLAPLAIVFKNMYPDKKVVYLMTEGGSLVLEFSNLVKELKKKGIIDKTITIGQSFGGDIEAVNIFTGLAAAREIVRGDLIITGMGPGIIGTGTRLGFSGVENAFVNYAVKSLRGKSVFVPRISMVDRRKRHLGISHHTLTLLKDLIDNRVDLVFPNNDLIKNQIERSGLEYIHNIYIYPVEEVSKILKKSSFKFTSMGRKFNDDPLFFITAGLAVYRLKHLLKE